MRAPVPARVQGPGVGGTPHCMYTWHFGASGGVVGTARMSWIRGSGMAGAMVWWSARANSAQLFCWVRRMGRRRWDAWQFQPYPPSSHPLHRLGPVIENLLDRIVSREVPQAKECD